MTLACLASQSCTELGPAQPQLVYTILKICKITQTIYFAYKLVILKQYILLPVFIYSRYDLITMYHDTYHDMDYVKQGITKTNE